MEARLNISSRFAIVTLAAMILLSAVAAAVTPPSQYVRPGLTLYYEMYKVDLKTKNAEKIGYIAFKVAAANGGEYLIEVFSSSPDINGKRVVVDVNGKTREGDLLGLWLPEGFQPGQQLVIAGVQVQTQVKDKYIVAVGQNGGLYYLWAFDGQSGLMVMHMHADPGSGAGIMWKLVKAGYEGGGQPQSAPPAQPQSSPVSQPGQPQSGGVPLGLLLVAFLILGGGLLLYLRGRKSGQYPQYPPYPQQYQQPPYGQPPTGGQGYQYPQYPQQYPAQQPQQYQQGYSQYQQQPRFCPRCGAPLPPGATVCPRCGARVA